MKKVLIMVLAADIGGYDKLVQAIRETWGKCVNPKIIYYYGHRQGHALPPSKGVLQEEDSLICDCEESLEYISYKTALAYKYVSQNFDFDYTFRCCCGSYVVPHELLKFVDDKPRESFYCGVVGDPGTPRQFASGSGYFLSRDLVKLVAENTDEYLRISTQNYLPGNFDDVSMGMFMFTHGVKVSNGIRADDTIDIRPGCYHYHFRHNVDYMYAIHDKLGGKL